MSGTNRAIALVLVVAITCLAALVFAGAAGWVVAGCGALALFSLAYFSATRRRESGGSAPTVQAITPASLVAPAVLRSLDDPIIVLDGTGRIVSANAASEAVIGAGTERKHISGVLRMPELLAAVERVLAAGGQENIEFNFLVPVERHFRAHVAAVPQESLPDGAAPGADEQAGGH